MTHSTPPDKASLIEDAFDSAVARLRAARALPAELFAPLGESLFWLVALDEVYNRKSGYSQRKGRSPVEPLMKGIRYVRNTYAH